MIYPDVPAAFINAISEEGTKDEAVKYLQRQWNETCALRAARDGAATLIAAIEAYHFSCEAGPLKNCAEWIELKKRLGLP